jgi:hypothetical protein
MVMIALPWFASELAALLVGAVLALMLVRRRPARAFDADREYTALETKVRHPYTYPVRLWLRKGE